jgi:hypothetical protein
MYYIFPIIEIIITIIRLSKYSLKVFSYNRNNEPLIETYLNINDFEIVLV